MHDPFQVPHKQLRRSHQYCPIEEGAGNCGRFHYFDTVKISQEIGFFVSGNTPVFHISYCVWRVQPQLFASAGYETQCRPLASETVSAL
jgi:hypothetical protein